MAYLRFPPQEMERQYNPRAAVPDHADYIAERDAAAAEARGRLRGHLDLRYGPNPLETLDVFPAARTPAPVQLYIHGGYWRAQDKANFANLAEPFLGAGATVALVNYDLCPAVTLDGIVAEIRRAVLWTWRNVAQYGGDPERLYLSGSSAGAHLTAMALAHDWTADGLPADVIKGAALITGIYDVEPVLHISVNADVRLDPEMARRNSPMTMPPRGGAPLIVAAGGAEPEGWIRQSKDYAAMCRENGIACEYLELPGQNHFTMTGQLDNADNALTQAMLRQMGLAGG